MTKEQLLRSIQELPDPFEPEQLIERLIALQQLEEGLEQLKQDEALIVAEANYRLQMVPFLKERIAQSDYDQVVTFEEAYRRFAKPE